MPSLDEWITKAEGEQARSFLLEGAQQGDPLAQMEPQAPVPYMDQGGAPSPVMADAGVGSPEVTSASLTPSPEAETRLSMLERKLAEAKELMQQDGRPPNMELGNVVLLLALGAGLAILGAFFIRTIIGKSAVLPTPRGATQGMPQNQTRGRNRISEGCHRIGIAVGALLGLPVFLVSLSWGDIYSTIYAIIISFFIPYGFLRLLGWIINGFIGTNEEGGKKI